jgi:hypothetical protein
MPNPSADSTSTYAYKPDFSFAFKDWIAGGVETLMWSFRGEQERYYRLHSRLIYSFPGNYSEACTLGILRHLFKYFASYYQAHSSLPCSLLLLQDLKPEVVQKLFSRDTTSMRRCGADDLSKELMDAISDVFFVESPPNEVGARIFERLWNESSDTLEFERSRALRRLKAELVANDRACRRLWLSNTASLDLPPKLFTIGPAVHSTSEDHMKSPAAHSMMRSPLSSRSHSYASTNQNRSSASGSTASLNTLGDSADHQHVFISSADDVEDIAQRSPGLQVKLWPSAA